MDTFILYSVITNYSRCSVYDVHFNGHQHEEMGQLALVAEVPCLFLFACEPCDANGAHILDLMLIQSVLPFWAASENRHHWYHSTVRTVTYKRS